MLTFPRGKVNFSSIPHASKAKISFLGLPRMLSELADGSFAIAAPIPEKHEPHVFSAADQTLCVWLSDDPPRPLIPGTLLGPFLQRRAAMLADMPLSLDDAFVDRAKLVSPSQPKSAEETARETLESIWKKAFTKSSLPQGITCVQLLATAKAIQVVGDDYLVVGACGHGFARTKTEDIVWLNTEVVGVIAMAADQRRNSVYVCCTAPRLRVTDGGQVLQLDYTTGAVRRVIGREFFSEPTGVAVDGDGFIYVVDSVTYGLQVCAQPANRLQRSKL